MAGADYDGIAGIMRLLEAGDVPDTFAIEVITYHAAIHSELERIVGALVAHPEELFTTSPKLSFGHLANLLRAVWAGEIGHADILVSVLHRFNDLRNAVAHYDQKQIKSCHAGLTNAYRNIDPATGDEADIAEVAQGICLFMQDGSNVADLKAIFQGLATLVNETLPRGSGTRQKKQS